VLDRHPELLDADGIEKLWTAVIAQAVSDVRDGGLQEYSGESNATGQRRRREAWLWLCGATFTANLAESVTRFDLARLAERLRAAMAEETSVEWMDQEKAA
jgi:hypothetical protein